MTSQILLQIIKKYLQKILIYVIFNISSLEGNTLSDVWLLCNFKHTTTKSNPKTSAHLLRIIIDMYWPNEFTSHIHGVYLERILKVVKKFFVRNG